MTKSQDMPFFKHVQRRFVLAYQRTRNCDELRNWRPAILKNPHADTPSNHLPGSRTSIPKIPPICTIRGTFTVEIRALLLKLVLPPD